jgi:hypothetical protein
MLRSFTPADFLRPLDSSTDPYVPLVGTLRPARWSSGPVGTVAACNVLGKTYARADEGQDWRLRAKRTYRDSR